MAATAVAATDAMAKITARTARSSNGGAGNDGAGDGLVRWWWRVMVAAMAMVVAWWHVWPWRRHECRWRRWRQCSGGSNDGGGARNGGGGDSGGEGGDDGGGDGGGRGDGGGGGSDHREDMTCVHRTRRSSL